MSVKFETLRQLIANPFAQECSLKGPPLLIFMSQCHVVFPRTSEMTTPYHLIQFTCQHNAWPLRAAKHTNKQKIEADDDLLQLFDARLPLHNSSLRLRHILLILCFIHLHSQRQPLNQKQNTFGWCLTIRAHCCRYREWSDSDGSRGTDTQNRPYISRIHICSSWFRKIRARARKKNHTYYMCVECI